MATRSIARPSGATALVVLIFFVVLLNYVDRGAIAVGAPLMKPELGLSATEFGIAVSAFFWVYAPIQYGVGWFCDRFCVYRALAVGVVIWALATMAIGLVGGLGLLIAMRCLLGLGESFTFPAAAKVIARHVPPDRRGIANSAIAAGIAFGPAIGTLVGGLIVASHGWRAQFVLFGAVTLLWVIPWLAIARNLPAYDKAGREEPIPVREMIRQPALWVMGLVHFTGTYCLYFAVTWFPLYLVQSEGFDLKRMTYIASLGFLAQGISAIGLGLLSDWWTRSGRDEGTIRRWTMIVAQTVLAVAIVALLTARGEAQLIAWMMVIGATNASGGVHLYAVAQIFAGPRGAGTFVGIQNATGNMSGIVGPILTGVIIDATGHYDYAFYVTAGVALVGALAWWRLVPSIRPINFPEPDVQQSKL